MKAILKVEKEFDVNYLVANLGVRYWEYGTLNGERDDDDNPKMPCIKDGRWYLEINVNTGQVENWEIGNAASVHYKVCDDGEYFLRDVITSTIMKGERYVPSCLSIGYNGYGDYVIINIDENGFIENWKFDEKDVENIIEGFF